MTEWKVGQEVLRVRKSAKYPSEGAQLSVGKISHVGRKWLTVEFGNGVRSAARYEMDGRPENRFDGRIYVDEAAFRKAERDDEAWRRFTNSARLRLHGRRPPHLDADAIAEIAARLWPELGE